MSDLVLTAAIAFVVFSVLSGLAIYAYVRLRRGPLGDPAFAIPPVEDQSSLDRLANKLTDGRGGGDAAMLCASNIQAFSLRALSAREATRSLDLQYYYWNDDLTGALLASEVLDAADRGVRVRLLLDDINLRGRDAAFLALDRHDNIEVRVFNPSYNRIGMIQRGLELVLRAFSSTRRMHNKAWIADGRFAIVGGRNIGDAYFDASHVMNFTDLDLMVTGPSVSQASAIFDHYWNSDCVFPIAGFPWTDSGDLPAWRRTIERAVAHPNAQPFHERLAADVSLATLVDGQAGKLRYPSRLEIVSDPPEKSNGSERNRWIHKTILPVLSGAKERLEITSPYFIPGRAGVKQLRQLVARGVRVRILTNSLAATDVAAVHGAYAPYRRGLVKAGVELYELKPDGQRQHISLFGSKTASLHTKAFTVDGQIGFVGSFNFDPRSISLNSEMGVLFKDEQLCAEIAAVFSRQVSPHSAWRVMMSRRMLAWKDEGRTSRTEPYSSPMRRLIAMIVRVLPIESQL